MQTMVEVRSAFSPQAQETSRLVDSIARDVSQRLSRVQFGRANITLDTLGEGSGIFTFAQPYKEQPVAAPSPENLSTFRLGLSYSQDASGFWTGVTVQVADGPPSSSVSVGLIVIGGR